MTFALFTDPRLRNGIAVKKEFRILVSDLNMTPQEAKIERSKACGSEPFRIKTDGCNRLAECFSKP